MSEYWRAVWFVPKEITGWKQRLDHLSGDEYLGTNLWPTQEACEARGNSDQAMFDNMGFPAGVRFLRAQRFEHCSVKEDVE